MELIFLLGQVQLININVLKRCVGTRAHLNARKRITAAMLLVFAVFVAWIVTTCSVLGLEIIYMQMLWIPSSHPEFLQCTF